MLRATQPESGRAEIQIGISLVPEASSFPNAEWRWLGSNYKGGPALCAGTPTGRWVLVGSDLGANKPTNELHKVLLMEILMRLIQLLLAELQPPQCLYQAVTACPNDGEPSQPTEEPSQEEESIGSSACH